MDAIEMCDRADMAERAALQALKGSNIVRTEDQLMALVAPYFIVARGLRDAAARYTEDQSHG